MTVHNTEKIATPQTDPAALPPQQAADTPAAPNGQSMMTAGYVAAKVGEIAGWSGLVKWEDVSLRGHTVQAPTLLVRAAVSGSLAGLKQRMYYGKVAPTKTMNDLTVIHHGSAAQKKALAAEQVGNLISPFAVKYTPAIGEWVKDKGPAALNATWTGVKAVANPGLSTPASIAYYGGLGVAGVGAMANVAKAQDSGKHSKTTDDDIYSLQNRSTLGKLAYAAGSVGRNPVVMGLGTAIGAVATDYMTRDAVAATEETADDTATPLNREAGVAMQGLAYQLALPRAWGSLAEVGSLGYYAVDKLVGKAYTTVVGESAPEAEPQLVKNPWAVPGLLDGLEVCPADKPMEQTVAELAFIGSTMGGLGFFGQTIGDLWQTAAAAAKEAESPLLPHLTGPAIQLLMLSGIAMKAGHNLKMRLDRYTKTRDHNELETRLMSAVRDIQTLQGGIKELAEQLQNPELTEKQRAEILEAVGQLQAQLRGIAEKLPAGEKQFNELKVEVQNLERALSYNPIEGEWNTLHQDNVRKLYAAAYQGISLGASWYSGFAGIRAAGTAYDLLHLGIDKTAGDTTVGTAAHVALDGSVLGGTMYATGAFVKMAGGIGAGASWVGSAMNAGAHTTMGQLGIGYSAAKLAGGLTKGAVAVVAGDTTVGKAVDKAPSLAVGGAIVGAAAGAAASVGGVAAYGAGVAVGEGVKRIAGDGKAGKVAGVVADILPAASVAGTLYYTGASEAVVDGAVAAGGAVASAAGTAAGVVAGAVYDVAVDTLSSTYGQVALGVAGAATLGYYTWSWLKSDSNAS